MVTKKGGWYEPTDIHRHLDMPWQAKAGEALEALRRELASAKAFSRASAWPWLGPHDVPILVIPGHHGSTQTRALNYDSGISGPVGWVQV